MLFCATANSTQVRAEATGGQVSATSSIRFYKSQGPLPPSPKPKPKPPTLPQTGEVVGASVLMGSLLLLATGVGYGVLRRKSKHGK